MKVRLLKSFTGDFGRAGDERDLSADAAKRLIERGFAEPVRSAGVERATAPAAEKAVTRSKPKKAAKKKAKK